MGKICNLFTEYSASSQYVKFVGKFHPLLVFLPMQRSAVLYMQSCGVCPSICHTLVLFLKRLNLGWWGFHSKISQRL